MEKCAIIMWALNEDYKTYLVKKSTGDYVVLTIDIGREMHNSFFSTFKTFEQAKKHFMTIK